jgi:SAM-dependent methyltransferase
MRKRRTVTSQELGLGLGLILGRHFLGMEDLHYGYWTSDLRVDVSHLPRAQEQHSEFLIAHIPLGVRTILDVGCGGGRLAKKLVDRGFQMDCVSPSPFLTPFAREALGSTARVVECRFEDLTLEKRYDLVLFSESFQYIPLDVAINRSLPLIDEGGYLLICDFFSRDGVGKSPLGGGHRLARFYDVISRLPLALVHDIDMTPQTAPTLSLVDDAFMNAVRPAWEMVRESFTASHPLLSRVLQWKFRRKIDKIERKHFSGARNPESFAKFKSYRLLLYQKTGRPAASRSE